MAKKVKSAEVSKIEMARARAAEMDKINPHVVAYRIEMKDPGDLGISVIFHGENDTKANVFATLEEAKEACAQVAVILGFV